MAIALAIVFIALLGAAATGRVPDTRDNDYSIGKILRPCDVRTQ